MIHIIVGSTLGNTEYLADHINQLLNDKGLTTQLHYQPDINQIPAQGIWFIITATHGAGDYPENIQPFIQSLKSAPPKMSEVKFVVIGIGDSSYDTFCAAGKDAQLTLTDIGATPLCEGLEIDVLQHEFIEDYAEQWLDKSIQYFN